MSDTTLPDGYTRVALATGTIMWVGPIGIIIHAEPSPDYPEFYDTLIVDDGDSANSVLARVKPDRLDAYAEKICRMHAGQAVSA